MNDPAWTPLPDTPGIYWLKDEDSADPPIIVSIARVERSIVGYWLTGSEIFHWNWFGNIWFYGPLPPPPERNRNE